MSFVIILQGATRMPWAHRKERRNAKRDERGKEINKKGNEETKKNMV
jgi:hypothetical protein